MGNKQICKDCRSTKVARLKWVDVNTGKPIEAYAGIETEWCFGECQEQTKIIEDSSKTIKIWFSKEDLQNISKTSEDGVSLWDIWTYTDPITKEVTNVELHLGNEED